MYSEVHITLTIMGVVAQDLRDQDLYRRMMNDFYERNKEQKHLLLSQIKHRAPHTLVVPQ